MGIKVPFARSCKFVALLGPVLSDMKFWIHLMWVILHTGGDLKSFFLLPQSRVYSDNMCIKIPGYDCQFISFICLFVCHLDHSHFNLRTRVFAICLTNILIFTMYNPSVFIRSTSYFVVMVIS